MSRLGIAVKAFVNPRGYNEDGERNILTILGNIGFGKKSLKEVLNKGYLSNTYVYSIINRIAETAADIPLLIQETNSKGDVEEITEGDFYDFVHRPNKDDNHKSHTYKSLVYQLATGNVFHYGVKPSGLNYFTERWNLAPQYVIPKTKNVITGPQAILWEYQYARELYKLEIEEVMHLRKFQPDPAITNAVLGLSPLQAAWQTLVASNEVITADASLIKNKGAIGMMASSREKPLNEEEKTQTQEALKKRIGGGEKYGSIGVTSGQFDFIKFAMSPTDLKILENGVMKLRDLCAVFSVSSKMFNDPSGATYNNSKEDNKKFYTQGVLPPLENDIDHFNRFFVPGWSERDNTNYIVSVDTSKIEALQTDKRIEAQKDKIIMEGINIISNMTISKEGKIRLLVDEYGFTEEAANIIFNIQEIQVP